jgi:hypothetical protein
MKVLKRFKEGDAIPEGAKFISKEQVKDDMPYRFSSEVVSSGFFFERTRTYAHYHVRTYYIYEVEDDHTS